MYMRKYTPSRWVDLPQTYLDPILVKYAFYNGFRTCFSTELISAEREGADWICTVNDLIRNDIYRIRTKFLFGADGGRSQIAKSTNAPMIEKPLKGVACNIFFTADLSNLME